MCVCVCVARSFQCSFHAIHSETLQLLIGSAQDSLSTSSSGSSAAFFSPFFQKTSLLMVLKPPPPPPPPDGPQLPGGLLSSEPLGLNEQEDDGA